MAFPKACFPGSIGNLLIPGSLAQHPAESKLPQFDPATPVMLNFRPALTGGKYIPWRVECSIVKNSARYETDSLYHRWSGGALR